jgi:hypothetical protein
MFAPRFSVIDGKHRLCGICLHGVVLGGPGENEENAYCLKIERFTGMDVVSRNRYVRDSKACLAVRAAAETAWPA